MMFSHNSHVSTQRFTVMLENRGGENHKNLDALNFTGDDTDLQR